MAGKISEYIAAGPLLGTELLDVSQVDGGSPTGYSTRKVLLSTVSTYISSPTIYNGDDSLTSDRIVDQDGNYLIFEGGGATYWQVDGVNDGLYYDYGLKRGAIGTEFPTAKWHVKGNGGQDIFLAENSVGTDVVWINSVGKLFITASSGAESMELGSVGGTATRIKSTSQNFPISGAGYIVVESGNGAGAGVVVGGRLNTAAAYLADSRHIQLLANYNDPTELIYCDINSSGGTQTCVWGSSDAEGQRFDNYIIYSEELNLYGNMNISNEKFLMYNGGTGQFEWGNGTRANLFLGSDQIMSGNLWVSSMRSGASANTGATLNTHSWNFSALGNTGIAQSHYEFDVAVNAPHPDSRIISVLNGGADVFAIFADGRIKANDLPVFADEAAAGVGGLATDMIYQTATGELRIKL